MPTMTFDEGFDIYVAGATLSGDAALMMLNEQRDNPTRFWIRLALAYLKIRKVEQAKEILKQLIGAPLG